MPTIKGPILTRQDSTPSAPPVGHALYPKSDGHWWTRPAGGSEAPLISSSVSLSTDFPTTAITASTAVTITGLSIAIPTAGTYMFRYLVFWKAVGSGGNGGLGFKVNGPANSAYEAAANAQNTSTTWLNKSLLLLDGSTGSGMATTANLVTQNTPMMLRIDGWFTATAAGTLSLLGYCTLDTGTPTVTFLANSFGTLMRG